MSTLQPVFVLAVIFGFIYGIVYITTRRKERQYMIDKGAEPKMFQQEPARLTSLKWGVILIGVALGLFAGRALEHSDAFRTAEEVGYFSMIALFGGLALVISHFLEMNHMKKHKHREEQ
ncbi:MAG: DUF6249 domain-containing protein [Bacteroidales bacterium]